MLEYWNVASNKEVIHFIANPLREILRKYYMFFLDPIIPLFHYSIVPIAEQSGAKF